MDIRCNGNKKFGELTEDGILEVVCRSNVCDHDPKATVLHRFDTKQLNANGSVKLIETRSFKDPTKGNRT